MNERDIFLEVLQRPDQADRRAYLEAACGGDQALRRGVEALLEKHERAGSFLESPAPVWAAGIDELAFAEGPGTVIGPYKLLEKIGEGGFGIVFMADQQQPIRRKVALKVLKPGMDTRQVIARFEAERQALALMDHPHIARVLEAGQTSSGRPYFVMELVKGLPITEFCDQSQLTPRERLQLFVHVCQAVQHAHQKGIIHRDLKPSNVLVTLHGDTPQVKVIDFGIAKALGQQLTDKTLFTNFAQLIGTPLYMSPEQAALSNVDVDTRSDIYSLGVLLYELLTGTTPFDKERLRQADYDEIRRIIREEEPAKPSTRISTLTKSGQHTPCAETGTRSVPTTIDTIAAQRKTDPRRLSQLFRGELDWIVMKALEKDRNRRYESASAFAADVQHYLRDEPVMACPPSAWYRFRKFTRRNKAALAVAGLILFFIALLGAGGGWVLRDRAAQESDRLMREVALDDEVNRALEETAKRIEEAKWPEATAAVERTVKLLRAARRELPPRVAELQTDLALATHLEEIYSRPQLEEFDRHEQDAEYAQAFRDYGIDLAELSTEEASDRIRAKSIRLQLTRALDIWSGMRRVAGNKNPPHWKQLLEVAKAADNDEWRAKLRVALAREDRKTLETLAVTAPIRNLPAGTLHLMGVALADLGAPGPAVALLREAQRRYPDDLWLNGDLAWLYFSSLKQYDLAVRFYTADLAIRPRNRYIRYTLGRALVKRGSHLEASDEFSGALELDPQYVDAWIYRGVAYLNLGKWDRALEDFSKAIDLDANAVVAWSNRGYVHLLLGQPDKALVDCSKAIEIDPKYVFAWVNRGLIHQRLGQPDKAITDYTKAIELDPKNGRSHNNLAWLLATCADAKLRDPARALELAKKAVELAPDDGMHQNTLGVAQYRAGDWNAAIKALEKSMALDKGGDGLDWFLLAMAHWRLGHKGEAQKWYDRAAAWMAKNKLELEKDKVNQEELNRFQAEAADLLGVLDKKNHHPDTKNQEKKP
jgi:serine/threonine protein kinase/Tfp pilus assembly protein PilF